MIDISQAGILWLTKNGKQKSENKTKLEMFHTQKTSKGQVRHRGKESENQN